MALIINVNTLAFMFLLVRMHNESFFGSESVLKISEKWEIKVYFYPTSELRLFTLLGIINVINIIGFTYYGREADNAIAIGSVSYLGI